MCITQLHIVCQVFPEQKPILQKEKNAEESF